MKTCLHIPLLALVLAFSACGSDAPQQDASASGIPQSSTQTAAGVQGMPGTSGGQEGEAPDQVRAQLQVMQEALRDTLRAMLPAHRQKAANMIAEFNREMREMNMGGDTAWNATVDSLRQDLVRMPGMDAEELWAFFPEHGARLNRLMEMHRSMMADMKM